MAATRAIVLVHGLGLSHRYYARLQPLLPNARAVDLAGTTLEALGDSLARQAPEGALLVGNSLGAQVAVELAASGRRKVRGLVLTGPTFDPAAPSVTRQVSRLLRDAVLEPPTLVPIALGDYLRRGPRELLAEARGMLRHPMAARLSEVRAPVIVLRGSRDPICSQGWAEELAGKAPNGRLQVVPGAAHAVDWSHPGVVLDAVQELEQQLGEE